MVVSIAPQRYLVERIGGEHVRVSVMVGAGDNPHTYEPKPDQLKALSSAAGLLRHRRRVRGVWIGAHRLALNRAMRVVDKPPRASSGCRCRSIMMKTTRKRKMATTRAALDPHVWTSPRLAAQQARVMAAALAELDPPHAADYAANLAALEADIAALDADLRATLAEVKGRKFMVFHPSWGYFARDYGLEQIAVEVGGQEPSAQELAALITTARAEGIRVVFAQPEFNTANATTIAREIGGEVLLISPLAEDWLDNLRTVADAFSSALAE